MALIEGQFGAVQLGSQEASLCAVGVVGVGFPGRHVFIVVIGFILEVGETQAARVLAVGVFGAGAAASKAQLGGLDASVEDVFVDEAKTWGNDLAINLVDHGDGGVLVRRKGAQLTPVALVALIGIALVMPRCPL